MESKSKDIRTQVEYYLSDKNLEFDKFFHSQIAENKEGWLDLSLVMNCPKMKALSTDASEVTEAVTGSEEVELSEDKVQVRRIGNKSLPALKERRKRENKARDKEDEKTSTYLNERHFKSPKILIWRVDEGKPNWRDMENDLQAKYEDLRILYTRADEEKTGHIAICTIGLNDETLEQLKKSGVESQEKTFKFEECEGEELNKFWSDHGTHYIW